MKKIVSAIVITTILCTACNNKSEEPATDQSTPKAAPEASQGHDQSTPKGVAEIIFSAARTGDFSQLKDLCDASLEPDAKSKEICEVINGDNKQQEIFKIRYAHGKIDGEPIIEGNQAKVNIKLSGSESSMIFVEKTLNLVKKDGKWFLVSF